MKFDDACTTLLQNRSIEDRNEAIEIFQKLIKDNYLDCETQDVKEIRNLWSNGELIARTYYEITFEGRYFITEKDGYQGQHMEATSRNKKLSDLESYHNQLTEKLNRLTGWVAGGTIALVIVEVVKILNEVFHWWHA